MVYDPSAPVTAKPRLVLAAVDMGARLGTEPGKAWNWACALSRCYELHIVTAPAVAERCRNEPKAVGWNWHLTPSPQPVTMGLEYYRDYARWCRDVPAVVRAVAARVQPVGLHHITLASFRMLPRYDRCGLSYTLGPLGGGEEAPLAYCRTARLPLRERWVEQCRPVLNRACAMLPGPRAVVRGASLALATTCETERYLLRMGARHTGVVFPDVTPIDPSAVRPVSDAERAATLSRKVRLFWSGRALWWKGGQLAIELLRRLNEQGVDAELEIYSYGPALAEWRRRIATAVVTNRCRVNPFVDRTQLLTALGAAHVFVYPTLHDSSSVALLEAYAMGVPSLSVGIGGPASVATAATGYNASESNLDVWLARAVEHVRLWHREPATWLVAAAAARERAADFSPAHLERAVGRWLTPSIYAA